MRLTKTALLLGALGIGLLAAGTYVRLTDVPSDEGKPTSLDPITQIGRTFAAGIETKAGKVNDTDFAFGGVHLDLRSKGANVWAGTFYVVPTSLRAKQASYWLVLPRTATNIMTAVDKEVPTKGIPDKIEEVGVLMHLQSHAKQASDVSFVGVNFDWTDPHPIESVGYGRYRFRLTYLPSHPLLPRDNMQQAEVELDVSAPKRSRFLEANPSPVNGDIHAKTWRPPTGERGSGFDGIIENERTRAFTDLSSELVFLGAGVLFSAILGAITLETKSDSGKRSSSGNSLPHTSTPTMLVEESRRNLVRFIARLILIGLAVKLMRRFVDRDRQSRR